MADYIMNFIKIENSLEKLKIPNYILLVSIVGIGLLIRVSITYWDIFLESTDAFLFLLEARNYSVGNFEYINIRPVWPLILSGFFSVLHFEELINYMNIIRIVSITISCITIFVIFKIGKKFVNEKYALFIAALFAFDPSLIQNSVLGIREPIFILLGLIAFYYGIHKNEKFLLLAFLFSALAFDTRINGIAIPIFLSIFIIMRFKSIKKIMKWLILGIGIFLVVSFPHIILPLEQGSVPFVLYISDAISTINEGNLSPSTYNESAEDGQSIIVTSIIREIMHLVRISLPLTWILAIIGLFSWVKTRDIKFYSVIASLCIIFIIAFPMYFQSAEYRNLLLGSPLLFLLAGVGLEKNLEKLKFKKTILVTLIIVLFVSSLFVINLLDNKDKINIIERENVARTIIQEFSGRFMGDLFVNISHNIPDVQHGGVDGTSDTLYYNNDISITIQNTPVSTMEFLMNESKRLQVDYLVIDNKIDNRYPIFEEIFDNEKNFPHLEKEYEYFSQKTEFQVKVFKINYNNYWEKEN